MRCLPCAVKATFVLGFLRTKRFSMATSPASSSFARWLDRLPLVSPVARCRKTKSASLNEERTVRIASRPGSGTSRSSTGSGLGSDTVVLAVEGRGTAEDAYEEEMVEDTVHHQRHS